nr:putative reverse transcriptase domain-containing protein [Tanacetum cinerariifolium]
TTEKISQIKDRLKAARDRQKSYANKRRKPLEFSAGYYVLLKVSPWKGVVRFGKKEKLAPKFVGPFEIIKKLVHVAYMLDLPEELDGIEDTFHMSNPKKCLVDPTLQVPLDEIQVDAKLNFVEGHVETLKREFKKLKRSRIAIVKVWWNSKRGPEFTWEREDQMKLKSFKTLCLLNYALMKRHNYDITVFFMKRGVTIIVSEPGYEIVGSKDFTYIAIRAEIREEFRISSGPSNSGGNPPLVTIHTWL